MELNPKCVRDVMLSVEKLVELDENLTLSPISLDELCKFELLQQYSEKDVFYTLLKLQEGNYIDVSCSYASNALYRCEIGNLTMQGHDYLDTIRSNKAFDFALDKINEIGGGATMEIIKSLALKFLKDRLCI